MLSRTAESLFWMARSLERAETMARLVDMGRRMSAIPGADGGSGARRDEWPSILAAAGCADGFAAWSGAQAARARQRDAITWLMIERSNPSSVVACIENARANARAARVALTREMWEAVNDAWIEARGIGPTRLDDGALSPTIDWVKRVSAQFRGATDVSSLRYDGYEFLRLGHFIERMDSTARLLDVRSFAPSRADAQAADQYAWIAILMAAGVLRAYHARTRADYEPGRIVHFLAADFLCPRSLAFCAARVAEHLDRLARLYERTERCHAEAAALVRLTGEAQGTALLAGDLPGFLSEVIRRNNRLATTLSEDYHFAPPPTPAFTQSQSQSSEPSPSPLAP